MRKLLVILSLLLVLAACAPEPVEPEMADEPEMPEEPEMGETIVMGAVMPLSGDAASYGEPISQQLMLAVDNINEAGGIDGKMLEIKLEDGKCNPKDASTAATKLIDVDGVKVIFGGVCSGETLGMAPIAEQNEVVLISPSATSPDITDAGDYVFRTAPSDAYAAKVAAEKAIEMGFMKAAILHETTDYAQGLQRTFETVFEESGGEIAAVESFSTEDTDLRTQALKIKNTNADAVYVVPQTPAKGALAVKQLQEQGVEAQLFTAELLIGRDVAKENAELFEGMIGVEAAFDDEGGIASEVLAEYQSEYGEPPWPFYQAAVRDAVYVVADAVREHGYDATAIKDALYATENWEGAVGDLTFDENGDPILSFRVMEIVSGDVIEVK